MTNVREMREKFLLHSNSDRNVHDNLKSLSVPELRELSENSTYEFEILCLNVLGDLNIGTIIRSSHLFGARRVTIFGRRRMDNRGLVGAQNYTKVERVEALEEDGVTIDPAAFWRYLDQHRLYPIFVEQGGSNVYQFDWLEAVFAAKKIGATLCLVLGTENSGIPNSILKDANMVSQAVSIPQRGVIRSHNVSMAFSAVCSQMIGQLGWY